MRRGVLRAACEHVYMLGVCAFLMWDVAYMTEAAWTFDVRGAFPVMAGVLAGMALLLCRFRMGVMYLPMALLGWMTLSSGVQGVLPQEAHTLWGGVAAFMVLLPAGRAIAPARLWRWLRGLLAVWTVCFTLQATIGLWAAFTGHAVFSLRGTWYIGVNLGDNRLYLNAYVTTAAVKMGLSALLAVLGAVMTRRLAGRIAYALCAAVQLACLSLTDCRTAFIAVGAALGVMAFAFLMHMARRQEQRVWCMALRTLAVIMVPVLAVGSYVGMSSMVTALSPYVQRDLVNITLMELPGELLPGALAEEPQGGVQHRALKADNLFNDRQQIWAASLRLLRYQPEYLLWGTTSSMAQTMTNLYLDISADKDFVHVHNIYLQTLVSWGVPGFLLLALSLLAFLRAAWRVLVGPGGPVWQRLMPAPVVYVLLCDMVDCFTRLKVAAPMLLFACLLAGVAVQQAQREVART